MKIGQGVLLPTLPNGGWSITVEFHFYLLFPLLVFLERRFNGATALLLLLAMAGRFLLYFYSGTGASLQYVAYGTLFGRIDQFIIGMLLAKVGAASYSIYLLHVFVVFRLARFVDLHLIALDTFYLAFLASLVCFVPVAFVGWLSYRYFERYWL